MQYITQDFPNFGFLKTKFEDFHLEPVKQEINKIQKNFNNAIRSNENLAGNILNEYSLIDSKDHISNLIMPFIQKYDEYYDYLKTVAILTESCPIVLSDCWVNFQKKHEFNPNHNHSGVLSFVIWINIPYNIQDEKEQSPGRYGNSNCSGHFEFSFINTLGTVMSYPIPTDKFFENTMILFPSKLVHSVYPFYSSDDYRISVAGNFKLKVD